MHDIAAEQLGRLYEFLHRDATGLFTTNGDRGSGETYQNQGDGTEIHNRRKRQDEGGVEGAAPETEINKSDSSCSRKAAEGGGGGGTTPGGVSKPICRDAIVKDGRTKYPQGIR